MNGVLLLPCVGPMQSWGSRSRFQERDTEREPTKSGVIGILCAALGRDRSESLDDLAALTMAVRVDREGKLSKDFQTAQDVAVASGSGTQDLLSNRYFLADAAFIVGLEGPIELLKTVHAALKNPRWTLFLGRKSYIPSLPFFLADGLLSGATLCAALATHRLLLDAEEIDRRLNGRGDGRRVRMVCESSVPTHETRNDQPSSFALGKREFMRRYVRTEYFDLEQLMPSKGGG